ncbi:hypothetical protein IEQ34_010871 [Dendrobium chrysotoxum]|uniref:Uncharacterized protein n=1 Tax=Dendrobium chrysotoxum TaxID=161865 RepID=A0AAV7GWU5_DENCH|nr:hypothetical protein IEQ34_010871 [Dendrobium chrysotoxum]
MRAPHGSHLSTEPLLGFLGQFLIQPLHGYGHHLAVVQRDFPFEDGGEVSIAYVFGKTVRGLHQLLVSKGSRRQPSRQAGLHVSAELLVARAAVFVEEEDGDSHRKE